LQHSPPARLRAPSNTRSSQSPPPSLSLATALGRDSATSRKRILLSVLKRERDPIIGKETPLQHTFPLGQFFLKHTSLLHGVDVPGDQCGSSSHRLELVKQRLKWEHRRPKLLMKRQDCRCDHRRLYGFASSSLASGKLIVTSKRKKRRGRNRRRARSPVASSPRFWWQRLLPQWSTCTLVPSAESFFS
jgi:hypothetical protein